MNYSPEGNNKPNHAAEQNGWEELEKLPGERNINDKTGKERTFTEFDIYPKMPGETNEQYGARLKFMRQKTAEYEAAEAKKDYLSSEHGKKESAEEQNFDRMQEKIEQAVKDGKLTEEHARNLLEQQLERSVKEIEGHRQDYEDSKTVGTEEEQNRYQEWLKAHDAKNQTNSESHAIDAAASAAEQTNTEGPQGPAQKFEQPAQPEAKPTGESVGVFQVASGTSKEAEFKRLTGEDWPGQNYYATSEGVSDDGYDEPIENWTIYKKSEQPNEPAPVFADETAPQEPENEPELDAAREAEEAAAREAEEAVAREAEEAAAQKAEEEAREKEQKIREILEKQEELKRLTEEIERLELEREITELEKERAIVEEAKKEIENGKKPKFSLLAWLTSRSRNQNRHTEKKEHHSWNSVGEEGVDIMANRKPLTDEKTQKIETKTEMREPQEEQSPTSYHLEGGLLDKDITITVGQEIPDKWFESKTYEDSTESGFGISITQSPRIEEYLLQALNIEFSKLSKDERRRHDYSALSKAIIAEAKKTKRIPNIAKIIRDSYITQ